MERTAFFSSFIVIVTFPLGVRYFLAMRRSITINMIIHQNTSMLDIMNDMSMFKSFYLTYGILFWRRRVGDNFDYFQPLYFQS